MLNIHIVSFVTNRFIFQTVDEKFSNAEAETMMNFLTFAKAEKNSLVAT